MAKGSKNTRKSHAKPKEPPKYYVVRKLVAGDKGPVIGRMKQIDEFTYKVKMDKDKTYVWNEPWDRAVWFALPYDVQRVTGRARTVGVLGYQLVCRSQQTAIGARVLWHACFGTVAHIRVSTRVVVEKSAVNRRAFCFPCCEPTDLQCTLGRGHHRSQCRAGDSPQRRAQITMKTIAAVRIKRTCQSSLTRAPQSGRQHCHRPPTHSQHPRIPR